MRRNKTKLVLCILSVILILILSSATIVASAGSDSSEESVFSLVIDFFKELFGAGDKITGGAVAGTTGNDANTVLLLHLDNDFSDSSDSGHSVSANGDAQISTAEKKFGAGSAYFDGDGDYLSIPDSPDFDIGRNDFTIDFWVNLNTVSGTQYIYDQRDTVNDYLLIMHYPNGWYLASEQWGLDSYYALEGSIGTSINEWHHMAFVRGGNNFYIFRDGSLIAQSTDTSSNVPIDLSSTVQIGCTDGGINCLNGSIDELRVSKGIARWTSNFDPPTSGYGEGCPSGMVSYWTFDNSADPGNDDFDANDGNVIGATPATGQVGGALSFDGVDDYVSLGSFSLTTYTVEFWMDSAQTNFPHGGANLISSQNSRHTIRMLSDGTLRVSGSSTAVNDGVWHHIAKTKISGQNPKYYIDGIETTGTEAGFDFDGSTVIGYDYGFDSYYEGVIDEAAVYSRALTAEEVSEHYQNGKYANKGYCEAFNDACDNDNAPSGLVSYWGFEEGEGTTAYDSYDTNPGTITGAVYTTGQVGGALDFDGSNDYVDINSDDFLDSYNAGTVEFWVKFPSDITNVYPFTYSTWNNDDSYFDIGLDANSKLRSRVATAHDINNPVTGSTALSANTWYHVAVVADGTNDRKIYLNGIEEATTVSGDGSAWFADLYQVGSHTHELYLANWFRQSSGNNYKNVVLDELAVYDRALSAFEINKHFKAGDNYNNGYCEDSDVDGLGDNLDACDNNNAPNNLVSYWGFEEGEGTTAYDSYDANPGTLTNMDDSDWVAGQVNGALEFDGDDDYVELGDKWDSISEGTITAWINTRSTTQKQIIFGAASSSNSQTLNYLRLRHDGLGNVNLQHYIRLADGTVKRNLIGNTNLLADTWYFAVLTVDSSGAKLYLNGIEEDVTVSAGSQSDPSFFDDIAASSDQSFIGYIDVAGSSLFYFNGTIDEVAIYNRALTLAEIQVHYNNGLVDKGYCEAAEEEYDLGDAPDSTNSHGMSNRAYTFPTIVNGQFPTVHVAGSPPYGPCHENYFAVLGQEISLEAEADIGPDQDMVNNIAPNDPGDFILQDSVSLPYGMDDGLKHVPITPATPSAPLQLNHCQPNSIPVEVTISGGPFTENWDAYLNIWIDYNRDGDWGTPAAADTVQCSAPGDTSEWVVQNYVAASLLKDGFGPGTFTVNPTFTGYVPPGEERHVIMRVQLTPVPVTHEDGSGPSYCYEDGETEDYFVNIESICIDEDEDGLCDDIDACDNRTAPSGLVSYWGFEEGEGTTAYDSYDANPGTLNNMDASDWVAGQVGGALDFDGSDDYIEMGSSVIGTGDKTISLWMYMTSKGTNWIEVITNTEGLSSNDAGFEIYYNTYLTGDELVFIVGNGAGAGQYLECNGGSSLNTGQWYHVVLLQSSGKLYAYVDGTQYCSDTTPSGTEATDAYPIRIGTRNYAVNYCFQGTIDEVAIYNRSLNSTEIQQHYFNSKYYDKGYCEAVTYADSDSDGLPDEFDDCNNSAAPSGMVSYWGFEEGEGTIAYDSYDANPGTINGNPVWTFDGQVGQAFSFDGVDDYVRVPDSTDWVFGTGDFSFEAWIKLDSLSDESIVISRSDNEGFPEPFYFGFDNHVGLRWEARPAGGTTFYEGSISGWQTGVWYHVALVRENGFMELYKNGNVVASDYESVNLASTDPIDIGRFDNPSWGATSYLNGLIDEVAIYNRSLNSTEIQQHYNNGKQVPGKGYCEIPPCIDNDGDGYDAIDAINCPTGDDCDDTNDQTYPGALEICDDKDNDCDGEKDEYLTCDCMQGETLLCAKQDGVCAGSTEECQILPSGEGAYLGCDDTIYSSWSIDYENLEETGDDGLDNDCNGLTDCTAEQDNDVVCDTVYPGVNLTCDSFQSDCVDNCPPATCTVGIDCHNPDQLDSEDDGIGDVCDQCPGTAAVTCDDPATYTAGDSLNETGGTLTNSAGELDIMVPAGAFDNDTSLAFSKGGSNFKVEYAARRTATVIYEYDLTVGQEIFNQPINLTFDWGTGLTDAQEQNVHVYHFIIGIGWEKILPEYKDYLANTITVQVIEFSKFAVFIEDDGDGDGFNATYAGGTDCNDQDPAINPGATEICNNIDDDCNAGTADGSGETWYYQTTYCGIGECARTGVLDCINGQQVDTCQPGTPTAEICDALDNDCDGIVPITEIDNDGDAQAECEGDCNDANPNIYMGAPELCDGIDNDCDTVVPDNEADSDLDGYRICENDCDDSVATTYPGAVETCNNVDDDCNSLIDDHDQIAPVTTDDAPTGWVNYDVNVVLTATDNICGVQATYYCVDIANTCTPTTIYTAPIQLTTEGEYYVRYYSKDNSGYTPGGNVESTKSAFVQIDKTAPTSAIVVEADTDAACGFWFQLWTDDGVIYNDIVHGCARITADIDASIAGLKTYTIEIKDSNGDIMASSTDDYLNFNFDTAEETYDIILSVEDNAANYETEARTLYEDDDNDVAVLNAQGGAPDMFDLCPAEVPSIDENKDGCQDIPGTNLEAATWCIEAYTGKASSSIYPTSALTTFGTSYYKGSKLWNNLHSSIDGGVETSYTMNIIDKQGKYKDEIHCRIDADTLTLSDGTNLVYTKKDNAKLVYKDIKGTMKVKEKYHTDELSDDSKIHAYSKYDENKDETKIKIDYKNNEKKKACDKQAKADKDVCKDACGKKDKDCKKACDNAYKAAKDSCRDIYHYTIKEVYAGYNTLSLYDILILVGYE